ncbi:MAG: hypothetical protein LUJ09_04665 [Firmicutes bacterium]|nr:hypothetical protein [Bacillota bacterium]
MKRAIVLLCLVLLSGCSGQEQALDDVLSLRAKLLSQSVQFQATVTADYGDKIYSFSMECTADSGGKLRFTVLSPDTIAGISGSVSESGGSLQFDGQALAFDALADGLISPVSGPWVLMKTLRSGYLTSCAEEGTYLRVAIDDSYADNALHLDIWLGEDDLPVRSEIYWQGRRLLSIEVKDFAFV